MRRSDSKLFFPYRKQPPLSRSSDTPWVIVKFPNGVEGLPVIYPCGNTHEETEKVRVLVEKAFGQGNPEG